MDTLTSTGTELPKEAIINFNYVAGTGTETTLASPNTTKLSDAKTEAGKALTDTQIDAPSGPKPVYLFQFDGSAQDAPATAWTEGDTFGATISFTFTAVANAAKP